MIADSTKTELFEELLAVLKKYDIDLKDTKALIMDLNAYIHNLAYYDIFTVMDKLNNSLLRDII